VRACVCECLCVCVNVCVCVYVCVSVGRGGVKRGWEGRVVCVCAYVRMVGRTYARDYAYVHVQNNSLFILMIKKVNPTILKLNSTLLKI
jgi:hypothetical protein